MRFLIYREYNPNMLENLIKIGDPDPGDRRGDLTFATRVQRGMSADLWLVWHHRYLAALVCKIMRAGEVDDLKWRGLLEGEARALEEIAHPHIPRLVELRMDAAQPYLLMEYLPGQTVRQVLRRRGRFSVEAAVRLTMYLGCILTHVHRCGYIHRDVKPSNVMLHQGRARLFDFGVAWRLCEQIPPDKSGTPQYLAPEQCRQHNLTPAVDIWAAGLFLFELLTGRRPFPDSDYHNYDAPLEQRYSQLTVPPLTLKQAGRRVPAGLQRVISHCLELDPAGRYASMEELLLELDLFSKIKIWPAGIGAGNADFARFLK